MIKVGIVGGTGYTGVELLRLLAQHPDVDLRAITSRKEAGTPVSVMFPGLRRHIDLKFSEPTPQTLRGCDVVFFATPNGVAMPARASSICRRTSASATSRSGSAGTRPSTHRPSS
jgi:N-acetyl-gamma-glutamyl-phosphate reductase